MKLRKITCLEDRHVSMEAMADGGLCHWIDRTNARKNGAQICIDLVDGGRRSAKRLRVWPSVSIEPTRLVHGLPRKDRIMVGGADSSKRYDDALDKIGAGSRVDDDPVAALGSFHRAPNPEVEDGQDRLHAVMTKRLQNHRQMLAELGRKRVEDAPRRSIAEVLPVAEEKEPDQPNPEAASKVFEVKGECAREPRPAAKSLTLVVALSVDVPTVEVVGDPTFVMFGTEIPTVLVEPPWVVDPDEQLWLSDGRNDRFHKLALPLRSARSALSLAMHRVDHRARRFVLGLEHDEALLERIGRVRQVVEGVLLASGPSGSPASRCVWRGASAKSAPPSLARRPAGTRIALSWIRRLKVPSVSGSASAKRALIRAPKAAWRSASK